MYNLDTLISSLKILPVLSQKYAMSPFHDFQDSRRPYTLKILYMRNQACRFSTVSNLLKGKGTLYLFTILGTIFRYTSLYQVSLDESFYISKECCRINECE